MQLSKKRSEAWKVSFLAMPKSSQITVKILPRPLYHGKKMKNLHPCFKDDAARRNKAKNQFENLGEHLELVKKRSNGKQTFFEPSKLDKI